MIDSHFRSPWQKLIIDPLANGFARLNIDPNLITALALILGVSALPALYFQEKFLAIVLILLSGLFDAVDGSVARKLNKASDFGCVFDIVSDRVVEAAIVLGLFFYAPNERALACLLLIMSFYLCVTTFLLCGIFENNQSQKSFHYSPGLIERAETFLFFPLVIYFDQWFVQATFVFCALVFFTAFFRFIEMTRFLKQAPS